MDLSQVKLSKTEWNNLECKVSCEEEKILTMIQNGYVDLNIKENENLSMISSIKIDNSEDVHIFSFKKYFLEEIKAMIHKFTKPEYETQNGWKQMKSFLSIATFEKNKISHKKKDIIRFTNMETNILNQKDKIVEFKQLEFCQKILSALFHNTSEYAFSFYTILQIQKSTILYLNTFVSQFITLFIQFVEESKPTLVQDIFHQSHHIIEKNKDILKYADKKLFEHQKELFHLFKNTDKEIPKLVLYTAPTGTGKTLSPLGLVTEYKIIFICAARHVGLALAKSAISMDKKVAFAFGCESSADIRLHYFAAQDYTKDYRSGGIRKVDNTVGNKVQIMICDVASYLIAMYYMLSFNPEENIMLYWDEPTITLDYEEHELHSIIHNNWKENRISKVVLSCATLPQEEEIMEIIVDFRNKFDRATIHTISSYDCKKSISILNKNMKSVLPHLLFENYEDIQKCVVHCEKIQSLLRYFDLEEIVRFAEYMNQQEWFDATYKIENYFTKESITMDSIKKYYLCILKHVEENKWNDVFRYMVLTQPMKFAPKEMFSTSSSSSSLKKSKSVMDTPLDYNTNQGGKPITRCQSTITPPPILSSSSSSESGILITTNDAHTLTDGPTIFLAENVEKIGRFYIQQSKIPSAIFDGILSKIEDNNTIQKKMEVLTKDLEDKMGKDAEKEKKAEKENFKPEIKKIMDCIENLRFQIQHIALDSLFIPNTKQHQKVWVPNNKIVENAFVPIIEEANVREIMELDVPNQMKILLLMGIGVFTKDNNKQYLEIIKRLAYEQKLYLVIASSDYIYGTNYQFCHCFIGKDLNNMTQQKIIQAMGRVGRSNIQQEYTIRFRNDDFANKLFLPVDFNMEAVNMCKLFVSS